MTCKTKDCKEELTEIMDDGSTAQMMICKKCRTGCEVYKASQQICWPILCGSYECGETCRCDKNKLKEK